MATGATLMGAVTVEPGASIWFGAVIRGDGAPIRIGPDSNVQDGAVLHSDPDFPVTVGARRLDRAPRRGARLHRRGRLPDRHGRHRAQRRGGRQGVAGRGRLVVLEGTTVPPDSLVAGVPAKVKRPVTDAERDRMRSGAASYVSRGGDLIPRDEQSATWAAA